jgi:hypothetical protein
MVSAKISSNRSPIAGVGNAIIACAAVAVVSAVVCFAGCGGRITPCREMKSPILLGGY